ncbi:hypothetical protein BH11PSE6_BH11PSE6_00030 [soil metagenome]
MKDKPIPKPEPAHTDSGNNGPPPTPPKKPREPDS